MLGTTWGQTPAEIAQRFDGLRPIDHGPDHVDYRLSAIADFLADRGSYTPPSLHADIDRDGNEVHFVCVDGRLSAIDAAFGYGFEALDEDPDRLSESAKHAVAQDILQNMVAEFAVRYGRPLYVVESTARRGHTDLAGRAAFLDGDGSLVRLSVAHMGGYVTGRVRYAPAVTDRSGF